MRPKRGAFWAGEIKGFKGGWSLLAAHKTQTHVSQLAFTLDLSDSDAAAASRGYLRQKIQASAPNWTGGARPMLDVSAGRAKFSHCIRLVIADPQPIVLHGLKSVFATQHDFEIVATCSCGTSCLEAIRDLAPDVALVAGTLPDLTASEILAIAKAENLPTRLMFFAESEGDGDLAAAIAAGACNAVSPYADPDVILRSLRLATERADASPTSSKELSPNENGADGTKIEKLLGALTHRERQIVQLVSEGLSNKEIARELNVSRGTVKVHLYNIFQKLEISNRTVLATIALLQRSTGFTTLSLALAFAILSDIKPSDAGDALLDDDSADHKDIDHPVLELWKKAILPNVVAPDSGETGALTQKGSFSKEIRVTHSAARMEGLHPAEQVALSHPGRGYGPIGSGATSPFISPLLQALNNSQTSSPTTPHQFPPLEFASNTVRSHGGYGVLAMTAAGIGFNALDIPQAAAHASGPGQALNGDPAVATQDGATQVAAINIHVASKVDSADADKLAAAPVMQDSHPPLGPLRHDGVAGEGNAGQVIHVGNGNDALRGNGGDDAVHGSGDDVINANDAVIGGDKLTGGPAGDTLAHLAAADSNSTGGDTAIDLISGADRINLAAFGALAFLHLTSVSKSVPPHTLAWIYNPASNETIVYVNPTDRSLEIGDDGLLEIHLQGVVSVAESDFVHGPDAEAVAAALEGIDPALLLAVASDGVVQTTDGADASIETGASESTLRTAGGWTMPAQDGFRFHFGQDRIGASSSIRLTSFENSDYAAEERDVGAAIVPVHLSPNGGVQSHATVPNEENSAFKKESGYASRGPETIGHGNPHAPASLEVFELNIQSAAIVAPVAVAEVVEPGPATGNGRAHDNSQGASQSAKASSATEPAELGNNSGNGVGHGNSEHVSKSAAGGTSAAAESSGPGDTPGHNNPHASQPKSASATEAAAPAEPGAAPGNGASHGKSGHASNPGAEQVSAELTGPSDTPGHGNSQQPSHAASVKAPATGELTEPDVTSSGGGHNNPHASQPKSASATEAAAPAEPGAAAAPGNGVGHGKSGPASDPAAASAEMIEPSDPPGHGNSQPPSSPASVSVAVEVAGGGHGNSPQSSHTASVSPSAATLEPGDSAPGTGGAGSEPAFDFKKEAPSFASTAVVDPTKLNDSPVLVHGEELTAILEASPATLEEHPGSHVQSGQHHALAHLPHDLLP